MHVCSASRTPGQRRARAVEHAALVGAEKASQLPCVHRPPSKQCVARSASGPHSASPSACFVHVGCRSKMLHSGMWPNSMASPVGSMKAVGHWAPGCPFGWKILRSAQSPPSQENYARMRKWTVRGVHRTGLRQRHRVGVGFPGRRDLLRFYDDLRQTQPFTVLGPFCGTLLHLPHIFAGALRARHPTHTPSDHGARFTARHHPARGHRG